MRPLLHPVYGFSGNFGRLEPIATFFDSWDALDFAMHPERFGFENGNVYCAEPRYDRRKSGYRYKPDWLMKLQAEQVLRRAA